MPSHDRPELGVLIVSDREVVRAGLAAVLRPYRGRVKVTGEVARAGDAVPSGPDSEVGAVLFEAPLAGGDGLDDVARLVEVWEDRPVVVLAGGDESRLALPVLQRGAAGFLLISIAGSELVHHLEEARRGSIVIDPSLAAAERLLDPGGTRGVWPGSQLGLSERQSEVLQLLARGDRTTTVARTLGMSEVEVKQQLRAAYRRLDVRDRPHALARLAGTGVFP